MMCVNQLILMGGLTILTGWFESGDSLSEIRNDFSPRHPGQQDGEYVRSQNAQNQSKSRFMLNSKHQIFIVTFPSMCAIHKEIGVRSCLVFKISGHPSFLLEIGQSIFSNGDKSMP